MDTFQVIAEPNRRRIIELLAAHGQLSASDIGDKFSISGAAVSQHLKVLRESNMVRVHKHAQQRIYELNPAALGDLDQWLQRTTQVWNQRLSALEGILAARKHKQKGQDDGRQ